VTCLGLAYFANDLINGTIFGEKVIERKMRVSIFYTTFETFLVL